MQKNNKQINSAACKLSDEEKMAIKYKFLREKIIFYFHRGSLILKIAKILAAVLFLFFTFIGIYVSHHTGHQPQWLQAWILMIFLNIIIFVIADYSKYLIEAKVIPYLQNDEQIEFGEYDIFLDDIDGEDENRED